MGITASAMFNKDITSSGSLLASESVNYALHLTFLSSGDRPSSVEEVEELFHVFLLLVSAMYGFQTGAKTHTFTPTSCPTHLVIF